MAHQSQLEIARCPAEGATAKRRALDDQIRALNRLSSPTSGDRRQLRNLKEKKQDLIRVIGVGKEGGHRDQVPKLVAILVR